jgi:hypothetical protein
MIRPLPLTGAPRRAPARCCSGARRSPPPEPLGSGRAAGAPGPRSAGSGRRRAGSPSKNHHGTPFIAHSTSVCGPHSACTAGATAGSAGPLTARITRSCTAQLARCRWRAAALQAPLGASRGLDPQALRLHGGQRGAAGQRAQAHFGPQAGGCPARQQRCRRWRPDRRCRLSLEEPLPAIQAQFAQRLDVALVDRLGLGKFVCTALANGHKFKPMTAFSSQARVSSTGSMSPSVADEPGSGVTLVDCWAQGAQRLFKDPKAGRPCPLGRCTARP